jgi:tol-pal system protein YbgF
MIPKSGYWFSEKIMLKQQAKAKWRFKLKPFCFRAGQTTEKSKTMIRSASLLALMGALWAGAAQAQHSEADLVTRIDRLQAQVRELTGTVEELQYRNQQLEQEVQRLRSADATLPGSPLPGSPQPSAQYSAPPPRYSPPQYPPAAAPYPSGGQAPGAIAAVPPATSPSALPPASPSSAPIIAGEASSAARRGDAFDPARNPTAPGAPRPLGSSTDANEPPPPVPSVPTPRQPGAPLDLSSLSAPATGSLTASAGGDLPPPPAVNPSGTGAAPTMQAALPPSNTPKDQYDLAYGYVLHKDFTLAAQTFRDFLHKYPSDRLAPEAQYWLGESLFQDKQYRDAAESCLNVSKYENTARAPDALLRLGQSLAALGEKEAACASLGEVLRKYPRASLSVKQSVDREQKRTHC